MELMYLYFISQFNGDDLKKNFSDINLGRQNHNSNSIQRINSHGNMNPLITSLKNSDDAARMAQSQPRKFYTKALVLQQ